MGVSGGPRKAQPVTRTSRPRRCASGTAACLVRVRVRVWVRVRVRVKVRVRVRARVRVRIGVRLEGTAACLLYSERGTSSGTW